MSYTFIRSLFYYISITYFPVMLPLRQQTFVIGTQTKGRNHDAPQGLSPQLPSAKNSGAFGLQVPCEFW
jgi:hypothetical protein